MSELPLNHEPSLNYLAKRMADEAVINEGVSWDHAYECAWVFIETQLSEETQDAG